MQPHGRLENLPRVWPRSSSNRGSSAIEDRGCVSLDVRSQRSHQCMLLAVDLSRVLRREALTPDGREHRLMDQQPLDEVLPLQARQMAASPFGFQACAVYSKASVPKSLRERFPDLVDRQVARAFPNPETRSRPPGSADVSGDEVAIGHGLRPLTTIAWLWILWGVKADNVNPPNLPQSPP
jgi:hypothetical protein